VWNVRNFTHFFGSLLFGSCCNIWRVLTLPDECASMRAGGRGYNDTCNQPCTACDRHSVCDCAIRVNAFNCMHAVCGAPRANRCAHATAAKSYSVHCTLGSKRDEKSIDRLFFAYLFYWRVLPTVMTELDSCHSTLWGKPNGRSIHRHPLTRSNVD
jgi:hypothetical protein